MNSRWLMMAAALLASGAAYGCSKPPRAAQAGREQAQTAPAPSTPSSPAAAADTKAAPTTSPDANSEANATPSADYQAACFVVTNQYHPGQAPSGGGELPFYNLMDAMTKTAPANLTESHWERDNDGSWILHETYEDKMTGSTHQMARRFTLSNADEQRGTGCKGLVSETRAVFDGREATPFQLFDDSAKLGQRARSVQDTQ